MSENVDFNPPTASDEQADFTPTLNRIASLNTSAKAVMPDGKELTRGEILASLGLNPGTSPTAWLTIIGCGSNASALKPGDLQRIATDRIANSSAILKNIQSLGNISAAQGFSSGGTMMDE